jgi:hypothetical protein
VPSPNSAPSPHSYRHLGTGGRPVRSQMILTLLALLILVAVPLYLWRRPKPIGPDMADAGLAELVEAGSADAAMPLSLPEAGSASGNRASVSEPKTIRCIPATGGRISKEHCDRLTAIENALVRSIRENVACAPQNPPAFTVSFVLWVDFARKKTHLWAGRSGTLKRRAAADLIRCVERAIPEPDWNGISHQYAKYDINVMTSYQGSSAPIIPIP